MATLFAAVAASAIGGAASTGAIAAGAGAVASTAATGFSGLSALSGVLSAGSALASIGQGLAARRQAKTQAAFANAQAEQELAAGAAERRDLAREYRQLTGEQQVIQAANGLTPNIGTSASIARSTAEVAGRNMETVRRSARNRSSMQRIRSRGLLSEGNAALISGFGGAARDGLNAFKLLG